jgi:hypothetical protein
MSGGMSHLFVVGPEALKARTDEEVWDIDATTHVRRHDPVQHHNDLRRFRIAQRARGQIPSTRRSP